MRLRAALDAAKMSQHGLAERIGVTPAAVNHWVSGKQPIPEGRIEQIEEVLGVGLRASLVDYETLLDDARTPLGFAILWMVPDPLVKAEGGHFSPRSAEDLKRRVLLWSRELGVTRGDLEQALLGNKLLPLDVVEQAAEIAPTILNPATLAPVVGFKEPEAVAVLTAAEEVQQAANTFAEAEKILREERHDYESRGLRADVTRAAQALDNGNENDDIQWFLDGAMAPYDFEARPETEDLGGRFRSMTTT